MDLHVLYFKGHNLKFQLFIRYDLYSMDSFGDEITDDNLSYKTGPILFKRPEVLESARCLYACGTREIFD